MRRHVLKAVLTTVCAFAAVCATSNRAEANLFGWLTGYRSNCCYSPCYSNYGCYRPVYYSSYYSPSCCPTSCYSSYSYSNCCPTSCCPTGCSYGCSTDCGYGCSSGCCPTGCGYGYTSAACGCDSGSFVPRTEPEPGPVERDLPRTYEDDATEDFNGSDPGDFDNPPPDDTDDSDLNFRNDDFGANYPPSTIRSNNRGPATPGGGTIRSQDGPEMPQGPIIRTLNLDNRTVAWRAVPERSRMKVRAGYVRPTIARADHSQNQNWEPVDDTTRIAGK